MDAKLADSFDKLLAPTMHEKRDPIARLSFAFTKFLDNTVADPLGHAWWFRVRKRRPSSVPGFEPHLKADLAQAITEGRVSIKDTDLAADIVIGIWLQVARGG